MGVGAQSGREGTLRPDRPALGRDILPLEPRVSHLKTGPSACHLTGAPGGLWVCRAWAPNGAAVLPAVAVSHTDTSTERGPLCSRGEDRDTCTPSALPSTLPDAQAATGLRPPLPGTVVCAPPAWAPERAGLEDFQRERVGTERRPGRPPGRPHTRSRGEVSPCPMLGRPQDDLNLTGRWACPSPHPSSGQARCEAPGPGNMASRHRFARVSCPRAPEPPLEPPEHGHCPLYTWKQPQRRQKASLPPRLL